MFESFGWARLPDSDADLREKVGDLTTKVEDHIATEAIWRKHIDEQLSLGRFVWLLLKTAGLTLILILTFKFGDISSLWKAMFK